LVLASLRRERVGRPWEWWFETLKAPALDDDDDARR
jgi:hypothetical protein